jgi:hypothetical protein
MVLRLIAHIIAGILLTGFVVWLIASLTDAAWKAVQRRAATRRSAVKLLDAWSSLADAQREQLAPPPSRSHLRVVKDDDGF